MEHIRVAVYRLSEGTTFDEIAEAAKGGMLDTFRLEPGFRRYEVADIGDGELLSVSLWESHDAAERAVGLARDWVAAHLAGKIQVELNRVGDVAFTAT